MILCGFGGDRGACETITYRCAGRLCAKGRETGSHDATAPSPLLPLTAEAAAELLLEYRCFIQISETSIIRPVRVYRFDVRSE